MTGDVASCGECYSCIGNKPLGEDTWLTVGMTVMIVCAKCGNKRCPHSTDHRFDCTGSNEPNQAGGRHQYRPFEPDARTPKERAAAFLADLPGEPT